VLSDFPTTATSPVVYEPKIIKSRANPWAKIETKAQPLSFDVSSDPLPALQQGLSTLAVSSNSEETKNLESKKNPKRKPKKLKNQNK